jgi:very-short-patch-repair endonuclease
MYKNANQREFARQLHREMTDAERCLWNVLRCDQMQDIKFRRQAAIGDYVVDFVCFSHKLVIELDAGQHNDESARAYDTRRTEWLKSLGFCVLRFWNHDVFENLNGVADVIWKSLQAADPQLSQPPSPPLPAEGREQF